MIAKCIDVVRRRSVHRDDYIALVNAGAFRGGAGLHGLDDHALGFRHSQARSHVGGYASNLYTELAAANLTALQQLIHNRAGQVGRNCKADSDICATGARQNLRIDTNKLPDRINERAARITLIDRRVGLQKIFKVSAPNAGSGTAFRANDSHRHGLAHAEGVTNR